MELFVSSIDIYNKTYRFIRQRSGCALFCVCMFWFPQSNEITSIFHKKTHLFVLSVFRQTNELTVKPFRLEKKPSLTANKPSWMHLVWVRLCYLCESCYSSELVDVVRVQDSISIKRVCVCVYSHMLLCLCRANAFYKYGYLLCITACNAHFCSWVTFKSVVWNQICIQFILILTSLRVHARSPDFILQSKWCTIEFKRIFFTTSLNSLLILRAQNFPQIQYLQSCSGMCVTSHVHQYDCNKTKIEL